MVISQGEVWWADLGEPVGSGPGFRRPVAVVQGDSFIRSALRTVVVVPLTSNLRWAAAPGNVLLRHRSTGLDRDSVANVSQVVTLDRTVLSERVGKVSSAKLDLVLAGIDVVLAAERLTARRAVSPRPRLERGHPPMAEPVNIRPGPAARCSPFGPMCP